MTGKALDWSKAENAASYDISITGEDGKNQTQTVTRATSLKQVKKD